MRLHHLFIAALILLTPVSLMAQKKSIIAHRGASGYLMEHNLPSVVLAVTMGADYIEQDLVMTKDDHLIVLHDLYLDRITNVGELFPGRAREDGKHYVIDFTLAEIKQLTLQAPSSNTISSTISSADTIGKLWLTIPTFEEELILIRSLEKTLHKTIGIYPEIKKPWFHKKNNKDISKAVVKTLVQYGYTSKDDKIFLQCFDHAELKRIRNDLFVQFGIDLKLIQLIDKNNGDETMTVKGTLVTPYNYDWMFSKFGLKALSLLVDGIGLEKSMLVNERGEIYRQSFIEDSHAIGLQVHVYTFRNYPDEIPPYVTDFDELLNLFFNIAGVDAIFTDHCGDAVHYLSSRQEDPAQIADTDRTSTMPQSKKALLDPLPETKPTFSPDDEISSTPLPEDNDGYSDQ